MFYRFLRSLSSKVFFTDVVGEVARSVICDHTVHVTPVGKGGGLCIHNGWCSGGRFLLDVV